MTSRTLYWLLTRSCLIGAVLLPLILAAIILTQDLQILPILVTQHLGFQPEEVPRFPGPQSSHLLPVGDGVQIEAYRGSFPFGSHVYPGKGHLLSGDQFWEDLAGEIRRCSQLLGAAAPDQGPPPV